MNLNPFRSDRLNPQSLIRNRQSPRSLIRALKGRRGRSTLGSFYVRRKRTESGFTVAGNFLPDERSNVLVYVALVSGHVTFETTGQVSLADCQCIPSDDAPRDLILALRPRGLSRVIRKSASARPVKITRKLRKDDTL